MQFQRQVLESLLRIFEECGMELCIYCHGWRWRGGNRDDGSTGKGSMGSLGSGQCHLSSPSDFFGSIKGTW